MKTYLSPYVAILLLLATSALAFATAAHWQHRCETITAQFEEWRAIRKGELIVGNGMAEQKAREMGTNDAWSKWTAPQLERFGTFGFRDEVGYIQCRTNLDTGLAEMRIVLKPTE